ncbi:MAG: hypothetical protein JSV16_10460 [Candidatus Hydrogenedentota bacterium]|nr:MAG: hypothetical protein JSV16_10460 [Candidatus Hydrogenedentota bacterium]
MRYKPIACFLIAALGIIPACSEEVTPPEPEPEPVLGLGFTDFPHANTSEARLAVFDVIEQDANMAVMHFDDGVPWQEALEEMRYDENYVSELSFKESRIPIGHFTYLAVTPIAFSRDSLAGYRGSEANMPLPPPWDTLTFDDEDVITAFTNHCDYMIAIFQPKYFAYAIEANMLFALAPESWDAFITLVVSVYTALKAEHADLPIFITLQAEFFHQDPENQSLAIGQLLPFTDFIAVSAYPFTFQSDPAQLDPQYLTAISDLAPGKRLAIAETAWPAEDVTEPYPANIPADEEVQLAYVERLLAYTDSLDAAFVCWFFTRDYDQFWDSDLQYSPDAALLRLWKDTGMYDGGGNPRPALDSWKEALEQAMN